MGLEFDEKIGPKIQCLFFRFDRAFLCSTVYIKKKFEFLHFLVLQIFDFSKDVDLRPLLALMNFFIRANIFQ